MLPWIAAFVHNQTRSQYAPTFRKTTLPVLAGDDPLRLAVEAACLECPDQFLSEQRAELAQRVGYSRLVNARDRYYHEDGTPRPRCYSVRDFVLEKYRDWMDPRVARDLERHFDKPMPEQPPPQWEPTPESVRIKPGGAAHRQVADRELRHMLDFAEVSHWHSRSCFYVTNPPSLLHKFLVVDRAGGYNILTLNELVAAEADVKCRFPSAGNGFSIGNFAHAYAERNQMGPGRMKHVVLVDLPRDCGGPEPRMREDEDGQLRLTFNVARQPSINFAKHHWLYNAAELSELEKHIAVRCWVRHVRRLVVEPAMAEYVIHFFCHLFARPDEVPHGRVCARWLVVSNGRRRTQGCALCVLCVETKFSPNCVLRFNAKDAFDALPVAQSRPSFSQRNQRTGRASSF